MSIAPVSTLTDPSFQANPKSKKRDSLTQEDFLNLFITQMRYQNPLEPIDNFQMASQMAQFSSLEALTNVNKTLGTIANFQTSMHNLQGVGLIGKKVETVGHHLSINQGRVSEGYYQLSRPGKATIQIFDAQGRLIRVIDEGLKDGSKHQVVWDGKNQQGLLQPDGIYVFNVSAVDEKGVSVPAETRLIDIVNRVSFENGVIYLQGGTKKMTLSDIIAISG